MNKEFTNQRAAIVLVELRSQGLSDSDIRQLLSDTAYLDDSMIPHGVATRIIQHLPIRGK